MHMHETSEPRSFPEEPVNHYVLALIEKDSAPAGQTTLAKWLEPNIGRPEMIEQIVTLLQIVSGRAC